MAAQFQEMEIIHKSCASFHTHFPKIHPDISDIFWDFGISNKKIKNKKKIFGFEQCLSAQRESINRSMGFKRLKSKRAIIYECVWILNGYKDKFRLFKLTTYCQTRLVHHAEQLHSALTLFKTKHEEQNLPV